jgi:hypothetical protein
MHFQATRDDDPQYIEQMDRDSKMTVINDNLSDLLVFTAQLKQFNENNKWDRGHNGATKDKDSEYEWKLKASKVGEFASKILPSDGKRKKFHWCEYHKLWTIHSPKECKKQPTGKIKGRKALYKKASKYGQKKKAYMDARAAFATLAEKEDSVSDNKSNASKSERDSNASLMMHGEITVMKKEVTNLDR